eukprot:TRINITY_DN9222_c0_g1_i1.p1 TRINITY_DN9222_c0_g1~~TRINITY_DN9222_c0_g1_i1.p1  ORF type:complete len:157 (-),score=31.65 TRINITY_DN9222_c0_g1_i1:598-1068(-)
MSASPRRSPIRDRSRSPRKQSRSRSPERARSMSPIRDGDNLYVAGLATRTRDQDLQDLFESVGKVRSCNVVKDPRTYECRGFAFVVMDDPRDAEDAVRKLNRKQLDGRTITIEKTKGSSSVVETSAPHSANNTVRAQFRPAAPAAASTTAPASAAP